MAHRLLWRRSATAAGVYVAVAIGILGTIVAARVLGPSAFGIFALVLAATQFFQALLDLTVEEALTKHGFRYVTTGDWGRLRRLFRRALDLKLAGGLLAGLALLALAPVADSVFDADGVAAPLVAAAALPLVQSPENVASSALLIRERYDLRAYFQVVSMGLRFVAIVIGVQFGVTETFVLLVVAQAIATAAIGAAGLVAFRAFPRERQKPLGEHRRAVIAFVLQSSVATGIISLRNALAPFLLGIVTGPTQVGLFRIAQAPQTGFASLSSPVRLILLTEQTRDWERGDRPAVFASLRAYMRAALVTVVLSVPVFLLAMPWLVDTVFGDEYSAATAAARIVLIAAAIQLVFGWTKSFPFTIGRPNLRVITHGIEALVLLPLVVVLGVRWEVTGAAVAVLVSTVAFALAWIVVLIRLGSSERARAEVPGSGASSA